MNGTVFAIAPREAHAHTPCARATCGPWHGEVQRILAVRLDHLGDVLMTTPALRALRSGASARHITLLASPAGAAIARHLPDVDEVIEYDAPWTIDERTTTVAGASDEAGT
ncbi:glycosyltransferase family 9 protein [Paraburkholderia sacchari]|uniref:glycosyltransferase family 9 protein n=1 Tax=Paraburkholderia sacchari TaxID=159450 RepID=UPI000542F934